MTTTVPVENLHVQAQVVYIQNPRKATRTYDTYNTRLSKALGILKIILGSVAVPIQIAAMTLVSNEYRIWYDEITLAAAGIWGGAFVSKV